MKPDELLNLARETAKEAGDRLIHFKGDYTAVESSIGHDIKVLGDKEIEEFIVNSLNSQSQIPVLAEESSLRSRLTSEGLCWVVDPIDGSLNFSRAIPLFCISIALFKDGQPFLGTIYDPIREEMFSGGVGIGAWLNKSPINVSMTANKSEAIICTGFPSYASFETNTLLEFVGTVQDYKKVRLLGSAALSLAYVAAGRADIYCEDGIMLWDIAAGAAIVKAAGGKYQIMTIQNEPFQVNISAKNANLD